MFTPDPSPSQQHEARLHVVPNLMVSTFSSTVALMLLASFNGESLPYPDDIESLAGVVSYALFVQVGGYVTVSTRSLAAAYDAPRFVGELSITPTQIMVKFTVGGCSSREASPPYRPASRH